MRPTFEIELVELKKERDKLVNFARIQTEKLHIAVKALKTILPAASSAANCIQVMKDGNDTDQTWDILRHARHGLFDGIVLANQALAEIEAVKE